MNNNKDNFKKDEEEQTMDFRQLFNIIVRDKWIVLAVFVFVFGAAAYYTFTARKVYEASASVLIDKRGQAKLSPILDIGGIGDDKDIQNELEVLHSKLLAENVARKLLEIKVTDTTTMEPIEIIKTPEELHSSVPYSTPREVADRLLTGAVKFEPVANSNVIQIIVKSHSAQEAELLANTYASAYYDRNLFVSRIRSHSVREFLDGQMKEQQQKLSGAENELQAYMQTHKIVSLDEESKKVIKQLAQLEADRDAADIEIQSLTRTLESYKQEVTAEEPNVAKAMGEVNDSYITLLQEQIAKLEVERDVTSSQNSGINGQDMYKQRLNEINAQVSQLREKLHKRTDDFIKSVIPEGVSGGSSGSPRTFLSEAKMKMIELKIQIQQTKAKKDALSGVIVQYDRQFNSLPQKSIDYARLERTRLSNEKLYLFLNENSNEAQVKEKSDFGYLYIIDPAVVPLKPVSPNVLWNLLLGMIAGLGLGIIAAYIHETINVKVGTPDDLKKRGYAVLTYIPLMNSDIKKFGDKSAIEQNGQRIDVHLITFVNPLSMISEAYRRLRTHIQYTRIDSRISQYNRYDSTVSTLLVTSPNPVEGKSTTVANLAITFAQTGKKVLLIDADFRKPSLHTVFNIEKDPGIIEVLQGTASMDFVIHHTLIDNLDLICCGTIPLNPSEILGSQKMKDLISLLRKRYDMILFDSPPLLAAIDAVVLSTLVDGIIMVVSYRRTPVASLDQALESIKTVSSHYLGIVINNFDMRSAAGYYKYGYRYKYGSQGYGNIPDKTQNISKSIPPNVPPNIQPDISKVNDIKQHLSPLDRKTK
jgi:tyrosine-protein kinase Etk/Wzc